MFFQQFKVEGLGCYSYVIGCPGSGKAFVVDPERHVQKYLDVAAANGMTITHVFDTHLHADHISGARELAEAAGAVVCVHRDHGAAFEHTAVGNGDTFDFGAAAVEVLETPGHTPNSISLAIAETTRSPEPMAVLTGDLLFVADVGRPDLAGEDRLAEQVDNLYRSLYDTLSRFPDHTEVYPAHGAGSLCGKGISPKPMTTLGYERAHNELLAGMAIEEFRARMTQSFQLRPPNFIRIVTTNADGPATVATLPTIKTMTPADVQAAAADGATLIDIRPPANFGAAFVPGSINIGWQPGSGNWLGRVADPTRPLVVIAADAAEAQAAIDEYRRVGFDDVAGVMTGGVSAWSLAGLPVHALPQRSPAELKGLLGQSDHVLLDVRTADEWDEGHIDGAIHKPLPNLAAEGIDLPAGANVSVICGSGYRSNIAGSLLKAAGNQNVASVIGGMTAWSQIEG